MRRTALRLGVLLLGGIAATASADTPGGGVLDLIVRIEAAQPTDRAGVERLLGRPLTCKRGYCDDSKLQVGPVAVGRVDYRFTPPQSLLVLEGFSECVTLAQVRARYPGG